MIAILDLKQGTDDSIVRKQRTNVCSGLSRLVSNKAMPEHSFHMSEVEGRVEKKKKLIFFGSEIVGESDFEQACFTGKFIVLNSKILD